MRNNGDSRRDNGELRAMRRRIAELEGTVAKLEEAGKELRELEKRYRLLFEESLSAAAVIDTSMTLVEANTQMARSLGYDKAELIGRNGLEFVAPRDREMIERTLAGAFRGEDIPRLEVDGIGRAGVRTFLIWASAIRSGPDGDIEGFVINGADITTRKRMEEALRRRDAILEAVRFAGEQILSPEPVDETFQAVLARLASAADVSQARLCQNVLGPDGTPHVRHRAQWVAEGRTQPSDDPQFRDLSWEAGGGGRWLQELSQGRLIHGGTSEFPDGERDHLLAQGIRSVVVAPIFVGSDWWGAIGLEECMQEREWSAAEIDALKVASDAIGASLLHRRAERKLRESEERYRTLVESAEETICTINADGVFLFLNGTAARLVGGVPDDLIGKTMWDLFPAEIAERQIAHIRRVIETGQRVVRESETFVSGGPRWYRTSVEPLRDADGKVTAAIVIASDIHDHKVTEEALQESEARYRAIVEQIPAITYVAALDEASTTLYISPQVESVLGHTPAQYKADPDIWRQRLHPDDRERVLKELARSHRQMRPFVSEYRMVARDGRTVWFRDEAAIVKDEQGRPLVLQGVMFDITERKRAEEATQALSRKLIVAREQDRRRLAMELHDSLGQKMIALHLIIQSLAGAETTSMPPSVIADLEKLSKGCGELIREVRAICQGLYPATLESLGLGASLKQLAQDCPPHSNIQVDCPVQVERRRFAPEVEIELFRIAQEAVSNALQHSRAKRIRIKLRYARGQIALAVTDDGLGFDAAQPSDGGLGLKTMGERARALGGKLEVTSRRGRTRVEVRVPAEPLSAD